MTIKPFSIPVSSVPLLEGQPDVMSSTWYQYFVSLFNSANSGQTAGIGFDPQDASGAVPEVLFHAVFVQYSIVSGLVHIYGQMTFPTTADTSQAAISLPVRVSEDSSGAVPCPVLTSASVGANVMLLAAPNAQRAVFVNQQTSANITNATMSGVQINFMLIYPEA